MKAILFPKYGSPDVLQFTEVEKPTPEDKQALVQVHAASANPVDWHRMRGEPILVRLVIDKCYPLSETAEAIRYLEHGHARGKVIITVDHQ